MDSKLRSADFTPAEGTLNSAQPAALSAAAIAQAVNTEVVQTTLDLDADLVFLYIRGIYRYDYLRLVLQLYQHSDLTVGCEARQNARCVKIVKKLAAELKIKLAAEHIYTLFYLLGLKLEIFLVVKALFKHPFALLILNTQ